MKDRKLKDICVVSLPQPEGAVAELTVINLAEVLQPLSDTLYVLTKNVAKEKLPSDVHLVDLKIALHLRRTIRPGWLSVFWQILKIITSQFETSYRIYQIRNKVDIVIFWLGADYLPIPVLMTRLLKKKIVIWSISRASQNVKYGGIGLPRFLEIVISSVLSIFEKINFNLVDLIVVESKSVIEFADMKRFKKKVEYGGAKYIDTNLFDISSTAKKKKKLVGYLGRFVKQKGVLDFLEAIPLILEKQQDVEFLIGGYGTLYDEIVHKIQVQNLGDDVSLVGRFEASEAPYYFNMLKLFVLPSYSEGLPVIVLEAMACGTVVLATPVGGIPDVIEDGKTGFILSDNTPECIAEGIIKILNHENLPSIINNARNFVEQNFSYKSTVERYNRILSILG